MLLHENIKVILGQFHNKKKSFNSDNAAFLLDLPVLLVSVPLLLRPVLVLPRRLGALVLLPLRSFLLLLFLPLPPPFLLQDIKIKNMFYFGLYSGGISLNF